MKKTIPLTFDELTFKKILTMPMRDLLALWHNGTYHLQADEISPIRTCRCCGRIAQYAHSRLLTEKWQRANWTMHYYCKECLQQLINEDPTFSKHKDYFNNDQGGKT